MAEEQPGGGLYLDGLVVGDKPSLARLQDVSKLVNDFAGGVFMMIAAFHAGKPEGREPMAKIEADAKRCGDIILGRDPSWDAQPWNRPARLGIVLKYLLPEETQHFGDSGAALFMHLAAQMSAISEKVGDSMTEDEAKPEIERICNDVTARILGLGQRS